MGSDPAELGFEAQALINTMGTAYENERECKGIIPSRQNTDKEGYKRLAGHNATKSTTDFSCIRFKRPGPADLPPKDYYNAGIALSDIYCDDYFRRIAMSKQKRQFGRATTNDVGTAASAGLGLLSAGSLLTGGVGTLFGLSDNLFRNYDSAFVVEPNLGKMLNLVQSAQSAMRAGADSDSFTTYLEAHRAVSSYAQMCSYVGMDALLDRAIAAGTDIAARASAKAVSPAGEQAVAVTMQQEKTDAAAETLKLLQQEKAFSAQIKAIEPDLETSR